MSLTLNKQTRPLNEKETKTLLKKKSSAMKELQKAFNLRSFLIALVVTPVFAYLAYTAKYDLLTFLYGTVSVVSLIGLFQMPYDAFKKSRTARKKIAAVEQRLSNGTVDVFPIKALRIAVAKEYEDEGDLYVIELEGKKVLFLLDPENIMKKGFPCLEFEVYEEEFSNLYGRRINPLSQKVSATDINSKAKWQYISKKGSPEHMSVKKREFDKVVEEIGSAA